MNKLFLIALLGLCSACVFSALDDPFPALYKELLQNTESSWQNQLTNIEKLAACETLAEQDWQYWEVTEKTESYCALKLKANFQKQWGDFAYRVIWSQGWQDPEFTSCGTYYELKDKVCVPLEKSFSDAYLQSG
nr:hypothetical protein [Candidatus Gracilibacteria bacterium]